TGVKVSAVKPGGPGAIVETDGGRFEAQQVLMAVGRGARTDGIGLEAAGVQMERGYVKVSPTMETSAKGVYAIGDMAGAPLLADKATAEILGVHIVGPEATEIIHEFAVGRTLEATLEEIMHTIHAHPTLSEAALEATLAALGQAIHI